MNNEVHSCGCIGPQNGEPYCPCMMRSVTQQNGRWVRKEQDLGPVRTAIQSPPPKPHGCICPPGAEATCRGFSCPRRSMTVQSGTR